jgi:vacuolar-type H+-ATPase subunit C/Vma6
MATALISSGNPTVIRNETSIGKKIDLLTADALPYYNSLFKNVFQKNKQNAKIICDFIISEIDNQNIKVSTKLTHLKVLCWFSKYLNNKEFSIS